MLLKVVNMVGTVCSSGLAAWKLWGIFQGEFWWSGRQRSPWELVRKGNNECRLLIILLCP